MKWEIIIWWSDPVEGNWRSRWWFPEDKVSEKCLDAIEKVAKGEAMWFTVNGPNVERNF